MTRLDRRDTFDGEVGFQRPGRQELLEELEDMESEMLGTEMIDRHTTG